MDTNLNRGSGVKQAATATRNATVHDVFWDFLAQMPPSMRMVMWFMSDRAHPPSSGPVSEGLRSPGVSRIGRAVDPYAQARLLFRGLPSYEQARIACALVLELSQVHRPLREAMVGHLRHVDEAFAGRVARGLAMDKMPSAPVLPVPTVQPQVARTRQASVA
jgi:catalase